MAGDDLSCSVADEITDYEDGDWASVVLDTHYRLTSGYVPPDLVSVRGAHVGGSGLVRSVLIADLAEMAAAARSDGVRLDVQSAFRTTGQQSSSFHKWVKKLGYKRALATSARPGHSEHQLGTAIDFRTHGEPAPWNVRKWATSATAKWLARNAWRYGFMLSYPDGTQRTTCYDYEPWHYRYFGRDVASEMHSSGKAPRVWLLTSPTPTPSPTPSASPTPTASPTSSPSETATPDVTTSPAASPSPEETSSPEALPTSASAVPAGLLAGAPEPLGTLAAV